MNVAIFTDNDFEKVNGVTTALTAVLRYAPADLKIRLYTASTLGADDPQYLAVPAVSVPIPFYSEMRMYIPPARTFLRHMRNDQIDVMHFTTPGPVGLMAMWLAAKQRVPMVGSFHTDLAAYTALLSGSSALGGLMRLYLRWCYGKCAHVLTPSEDTRQLLIRSGSRPETIGLWTRGVDPQHFSPARRSRRLRDDWHVSDRRPALLYVGRVSKEKGLDLLPAVQHALHDLGVQHRFIIAGQGPMLPELHAKMPDAVFTGVLSRDAVAEAFASADLFVFPSCTDTSGNVVLEAQASGLPVVVTDVGGPKELIVPERTGLVCAEQTAQAWAERLAALIQSPGRRQEMAQEARAYAVERCWETALSPLYDAYRTVAAAHASVTSISAERRAIVTRGL